MSNAVRGVGPVTGGVMLILAGVAFAMERFAPVGNVWQWLPLFVVYLAARDLRNAPAGAPRTIVPLLFGVWLQISAVRLFGLDFLNAWPLLIVFVGLGLVIDGLMEGTRSQRQLPDQK
jgi:hypothetical protein